MGTPILEFVGVQIQCLLVQNFVVPPHRVSVIPNETLTFGFLIPNQSPLPLHFAPSLQDLDLNFCPQSGKEPLPLDQLLPTEIFSLLGGENSGRHFAP